MGEKDENVGKIKVKEKIQAIAKESKLSKKPNKK